MSGSARVIRAGDPEWPFHLTQIPRPPDRLWLEGCSLRSGRDAVAVVGTRRPTAAGLEAARDIARGLAQAGFVVVSGLAVGIDTAAHKAAIEAGGETVAVLGCGLDHMYPRVNTKLRKDITSCGTVASEFTPDTPPRAAHFPQRNRIIAGLSSAVVVIEGSLRSGARITASFALDFDRDVFAVPGSIRNPMAAAPNELIRTSQATLVTDIKHITDELAPGLVWDGGLGREEAAVALDDHEKAVLSLLDDVPVSPDFVGSETRLPPGRVAVALSRLEVRNLARRRPGGYELTEAGGRARSTLFS
ncbi:MAG TPA: DNA-processing protein DprA [Actinomycetota bacterium]|nr:DNA-processing protein DprA [Actinomycetota bacterium]